MLALILCISEAKADVVGMQEAGDSAVKLAQLLGWNHYGPILTRYEIVEEKRDGIKVKLLSDQQAYIFNLHLPSNPYQPYQLMGIRPKFKKHRNPPFIKTEAEAIEGAQKARGRDIARLLRLVRSLSDKKAPVFIVGDFNEPSHLDWTEKAAQSGRHPIKVEFPTSKVFAKAGFTDAYRTIYPDEMEKPGFTWSPAYKDDDPRSHPDRIDFVYFRGNGVKVTDAKIVGENEEIADIVVAPYPSDHRAVVATFTLAKQTQRSRMQAAENSRNINLGKR
jgi:endonuclease/exonuclease/phosphatase family metal-dependent hydrolase